MLKNIVFDLDLWTKFIVLLKQKLGKENIFGVH